MHWHASEECFRWDFKATQVLSASMFTPYSWTTYLLNSKHLCKAKTFRFCDYPHNVWITSSCCLHYARVIISPAECHAANSTQEIEWCEGVLWFTAIYACPDYTSEKIFISPITMTKCTGAVSVTRVCLGERWANGETHSYAGSYFGKIKMMAMVMKKDFLKWTWPWVIRLSCNVEN